jgi:shikimate kinase
MNKILKKDGGITGFLRKKIGKGKSYDEARDMYYARAHKEFKKQLTQNKTFIFDLGGGVICSKCLQGRKNLKKLKKISKLILILPYPNKKKNMDLLFKRERKIKYWKKWKNKALFNIVKNNYNELVPIMKKNADHIIYCATKTPKKIAKEILVLTQK